MSGRRREDDRRGDAAPAAFAVECPGCRTYVAVTRELVGRVAGCPLCRAAFIVPVPAPAERRPPRPEVDPRRAAPAVAAPEPREAARPEAARPVPAERSQSRDEPLVLSEPPVPSPRRLRDGSRTAATTAPTEAANPLPDATTTDATAPAVVANGLDGLTLQDPVKIIRSGGVEIELRRLTPEEKQARRARRNLIILVVGASLLVALVVLLGKGGR